MADEEATVAIRAIDRITAPIRRMNAAVDSMTRPLRRVQRMAERISRETGFSALAGSLRRAGSAAAGLGRHLSGIIGPLGALTGVASVAGLTNLVGNFASGADELTKFSRQVGLSVEALQEYQFVAERQGVSQSAFNTSMIAFSKRMGELRAGTGGLYGLLKKVNPAFAEQLKNTHSTEEAFGLLMHAMTSLEDPQKRSALAAAAFSRSGTVMTRIAEAGAEGIAELRAEARRLGLVFDEETGHKAESFMDSMANLQAVFTGLKNAIGGDLLPHIQPLIDQFKTWLLVNRELIAQKIGAIIQRVAEALQSVDWAAVWAGITGIIDSLGSAVDAVGGWENALLALVAVMNGGLIGSVLSVGKAFLGLGRVVLANPVLAAVALIAGAVYVIYENWDKIVEWFQARFARIRSAFDVGFVAGVTEILRSFNPVSIIMDAIDGLVSYLFGVDLGTVARQAFNALPAGAREILETLFAPAVWVMDKIDAMITSLTTKPLGEAAADVFNGFVDIAKAVLLNFNPALLVARGLNALVKWLFDVDLGAAGEEVMNRLWDGFKSVWGRVEKWLGGITKRLTSILPDWAREKLGLDLSEDRPPPQAEDSPRTRRRAREILPPVPALPDPAADGPEAERKGGTNALLTATEQAAAPAEAARKRMQETATSAGLATPPAHAADDGTGRGAEAAGPDAPSASGRSAASGSGDTAAPSPDRDPLSPVPAPLPGGMPGPDGGAVGGGRRVMISAPVTVSVHVTGEVDPLAIKARVTEAVGDAMETWIARLEAGEAASLYD